MTKPSKRHQLAAALTAGALIGQNSGAYAQAVTISDLGTNMEGSVASLPSLISTVAYIGGIGLGVAGIFKLKNHVDNPGQTPMKDGLVRLGAGGGLLALPYLTSAMMGSINNGNNTQATETLFAPPQVYGGNGG